MRRISVATALIAVMTGQAPASEHASAPVIQADPGRADASDHAADWRVPHRPGIYLLADWLPAPRMIRVEPIAATQTKAGGSFGFALTGGIAPIRMKSVVPGPSAQARSQVGRPSFFFYLDTSERPASNGAQVASVPAGGTIAAASPGEFSLVRFDVKKTRREAQVGRYTMFAGMKSGVTDKDRIPFDVERLAAGVFKVTPQAALPAGEYGFFHAVAAETDRPAGEGVRMTADVFDFSVAPAG